MPVQRKMVEIDVVETSGVDHPAHLHEGWLVMKAADSKTVESIFGKSAIVKEVKDVTEEEIKKAAADAEALVKATALETSLKAKVADLEKQLAEAKKGGNPFGKSTEEGDVTKSVELPEAVKEMLRKAADETEDLKKAAAADREAFVKERDARLDEKAIAESEKTYKSLAFDHSVVAPALRKFAGVDADTAKVLTEVLKAAEGQLDSAGIFQELGKSSENSGASALDQLNAAAKVLKDADANLTPELAFSKAVDANPKLYTDYKEGK